MYISALHYNKRLSPHTGTLKMDECSMHQKPLSSLQGAATFSRASGAISSPTMPGSLPSTPSSRSTSSQFLAGLCTICASHH